jgi:hypothetical protein
VHPQAQTFLIAISASEDDIFQQSGKTVTLMEAGK